MGEQNAVRTEKEVRKDKNCENLTFAAKEAFKRLRTNIIMSFPQRKTCCTIGVTSSQPSEGKSTVSLNLAYSLAELGDKVLLIDADMRRSSIHKKLGIELMPGLSNLLEDTNSISTVVKKYHSSTDDTWLDIITGGSTPLNPSELLNSKRMEQLLKALKSVYDYIVIDLPPVGAVIDAVAVSKQTDGMLVVIRENNCPRRVLTDCIDQLKFANINILGFVMNGALEGAGKRYQYSSYYK